MSEPEAPDAHRQTYRLFRRAILARKQVTCVYRGRYREVCPHILGHKDGQEKALTYQFGGQSTSGLPPGGEWRCLTLADVEDARLRDGAWHEGQRHTRTQACIDSVDVDVNLPSGPKSPPDARKDPDARSSKQRP